ncbi:hypothetical protein JCM8547_006211 [Rhodosporidiobolus lusitaniae]
MELVASNGAGQLASTSSAPSKPNKATAKAVPAFLNKLYSMVSDPATDELIYWSDDGDSFFITSADKVAKDLLPRFFKHSNFGSFVRQLNMYGFHKVPHLQQGVLKKDQSEEADLLEFSNTHFQRGQPDLLCLIKRQKAKAGDVAGSGEAGALDFPSLLTDLAAIRKHQTAISADLKDLQERNHALWQEAVGSREKHKKQEETINKILRFLAGVFGGQVLDQGSGGGSPVVEVGQGAAAGGHGPGAASTGGKGKGKAGGTAVAVMPKRRSTLLLEDVKGRQAERAAALRELDGDEDDEIEEIPLLDHDDEEDSLPTISSSMIPSAPAPTSSAISRAPTSSSALTAYNRNAASPARISNLPSPANRFTAITTPSPMPTPSPLTGFDASQVQLGGLSQDTINALLQAAGNNPEALTAFLSQQQQQLGGSNTSNALATAATPTSATPYNGFSQSLIPSSSASSLLPYTSSAPTPSFDLTAFTSAPTSNALFSPSNLPNLPTEYAQNNAAISSLNNESYDIHQRTAALESQIASLMDSLPEDAREQVERASTAGSDVAQDVFGEGFNWGSITGEDGQLDLDKMLAQFTDSNSSNVDPTTSSAFSLSPAAPAPAADTPVDFSSFLASPPTADATLDPTLSGLSASSFLPPTSTSTGLNPRPFPYEVTTPDSAALNGLGPDAFVAAASPSSTVGGDAPTPGGGGGGGKKKAAGAGGGGGRKRKSDVLGEAESPGAEGPASPAASETGTRRSARKKRG